MLVLEYQGESISEYWSSTIDERVVCWTEFPVSQHGNWPTDADSVRRPKEQRTDTEEDGLVGQSIVWPVHGAM